MEQAVIQTKKVDNREVIEVKGKHILLSQVKPHIENLFASSAIEEAHILAGISLSVDTNLSRDLWHGKNLVVLADVIIVGTEVIWDVSGKDNDHVYRSNAGTSSDGVGKDGSDGYPGESGGNVLVMTNKIQNPERLTIISNGGNGSNGQDGGDGKDGVDGKGISKAELKKKFLPCAELLQIFLNGKEQKIIENLECLAQDVKIKWLGGKKDAVYMEVVTPEGNEIIFSRCYSWFKIESFLLCKGTPGQPGKRGGEYGKGGQGGYAGKIEVKCLEDDRKIDIKIRKCTGIDGDAGKAGSYGAPGKNGWDMGYRDVVARDIKFYGEDEKIKLKMSYYKEKSSNRVYCPYKKAGPYPYAEIEESNIEIPKAVKKRNNNMARSERQHHSKAVSMKTITGRHMVPEFYEYLSQIDQERLQLERTRFDEHKKDRLAQLEIEQDQIRMAQEQNTKERQRLQQERYAERSENKNITQEKKSHSKLEQEKLAKESHRLEQQRLADERQRLHEEKIARENDQRLEQLRIIQEKLRSEQERIAAEKQKLKQETAIKENQLQQQMKIAREREQLTLNQVQTSKQQLEQLEIKEGRRRIEQQQRELEKKLLERQIESEEQDAKLQQISKKQQIEDDYQLNEEHTQQISTTTELGGKPSLQQERQDEEELRLNFQKMDIAEQ